MTRNKMFHRTRLFRSIDNPPTPEDASSRRWPIAELWSAKFQSKGLSRVDVYWLAGVPYTVFTIMESPSEAATHWRWAEPVELKATWEFL